MVIGWSGRRAVIVMLVKVAGVPAAPKEAMTAPRTSIACTGPSNSAATVAPGQRPVVGDSGEGQEVA